MIDITGLITNPMVSTTGIVIGIINIVIIIISLIYGIWLTFRFAGRLRAALIFLILAVLVVLIREVLVLVGITAESFVVGIMRLLIVLFILFAIISMKLMVNYLDGKYKE